MTDPNNAQEYVLGHTDRELRRLTTQAQLIEPITRNIFRSGEIAAGMRVLDIGCGAGHVSFIAADLVGPSGAVLGVDLASAAVAAATAEARARSLENVSFLQGDPAAMSFDEPFDAVVGRYVLQFQADPVQLLRSVASHVRPGGVVVFHELDWSGVWSFPSAPIHDQCCAWAAETIRLSGAETQMGLKLRSTFVAAGLAEPGMKMQAVLGGGTNSLPSLHQLFELVGSLAPAMERLGVATAADIGYETLWDRMSAEATALGTVIVGRLQVGCWSRV